MSSSWLKEYVLEGLGSEIRNIYPLEDDDDEREPTSEEVPARLVQILGRGQGGLEETTSRNLRSRAVSTANNGWWKPSKRGKSPNLAKHTDAWILVSDGSHSAKLYLTTEALKDVFEADNKNNNEDDLFRCGCCVMLKRYFLDCYGGNPTKEGHSVHLKVSSLEPKPGFNLHQEAKRTNSGDASVRPVMEETDVLYGLQSLAQLLEQQAGAGGTRKTRSSTKIARDWEIAFGRLSKGHQPASPSSSTTGEEETAIRVVPSTAMQDILKLAEAAASTEEAVREWELAKREFGILSNNKTNENEPLLQTRKARATPTQSQMDEQEEDADQEEEDVSRMYIQNVLAASDEDESKGNQSSDDEDPRAFETQPTEGNALVEERVDEDDDESENGSVEMLQTQPAEEEVTGTGKRKTVNSTSNKKRKRHRTNSEQQLRFEQQQENSQGSAGIWESVKEQLFEPGRTVVRCVPLSRLPEDENGLVTPKRPLVSSTDNARTPNPSSGAYYRKYGLSRWLSQNTTSNERSSY